MSKRGHGQIRRSQVITTWGPGALIDLPRHAAIVGGLETWPREGDFEEISEPRLSRRLERMTGVGNPRLYAPPIHENDPGAKPRGIGAYSFPEYFLVQEKAERGHGEDGERREERSRRLVHRKSIEKGRFDGCQVVPIRFVRACARGHVDDLDWFGFVHGDDDPCRRQLWLEERGTSGDLGELVVRCECGKSRRVSDATRIENIPLGLCNGARPWLGPGERERGCHLPFRLLVRTASSAYFPQSVAALSLPDRRLEVDGVVRELWDDLNIVTEAAELAFIKKKPKVTERLAPFGDAEVLAAIQRYAAGGRGAEVSVKLAEIGALMGVPEGFGDDVPVDPDFHARRLPDHVWRRSQLSRGIAGLVQVHRLREVVALIGFTRFEPVAPNIQGEFEANVERAPLQAVPSYFPAVENRGEGIFLHLDPGAVAEWLGREAVQKRLADLARGHQRWLDRHNGRVQRPFPGGPYVLLHTLSHLLLQSLAMRCGYPASSIRERIYVDADNTRYGILLYTGSPDAEGTLGGLVQQARHLEDHLADALQRSELCSNDPICAHHTPGESLEERWLLGAACHGCVLVAETSCEVRNDYLDRALVVPVPGHNDAAFFRTGR